MHADLFNKILVVDDTVADLQLLTNLLTGYGYAVYPVSDEEAALEFIRSTIPDLILLDFKLPGMDSEEALRRLRADVRLTSVPVIFIIEECDKEKGFQEGIADYIMKPFQPREVLARIETHRRLLKLTDTVERLQQELAECQREETALRESEAHYHGLFDRVPIGLYQAAPSGQILDVNLATVQMLGFPDREAMLEVNAVDFYADPRDRDRFKALIEVEGVVRDFEVQFRRWDGTIIWVRNSGRVVRDKRGNILCYEGSLEDIIEYKRNEEMLRKRNEELERFERAVIGRELKMIELKKQIAVLEKKQQ